MKIYVGNLDSTVTDDMIRNLFSPFGETGKVTIMRDRRGISKGFGFVEMPAADAAGAAISSLNRTIFHNRTLDISEQAASPRAGHDKNKARPPRFHR